MWKELKPFQKSNLELTLRSQAKVEIGVLKISFELTGELDKLLFPKPGPVPARVIGLWESTCFEMFLKNKNAEEYFEFNCTTANNWNCFYFPRLKAPLKEYNKVSNLASSTIADSDKISLSFWIDIEKFPKNFWSSGEMNLGLTSVIESTEGELSYWALEHKDTKPNFHIQDSFTYEL